MERRVAIQLLVALGVGIPTRAMADRVSRVGLIWNSLPQADIDRDLSRFYGPGILVEGLRKRGWVRGRNLELVSLSAEGRYERFPAMVDKMVAMQVDVMVVFGSDAAAVARERARGIPIVDTVAFNQAPGRGGIVGMVVQNPVDKRLELLKYLVPTARKVALFAHAPKGGDFPVIGDVLRARIERLGMTPKALHFTSMADLDGAFEEAIRWGAQAAYMSGFPKLYWDPDTQEHVVGLAARHRVPTVYEVPHLAARGALIGFGPDERTTHDRAAYFIDRILRGARPEDLPAEQPTGFVLTLNRATARELGLVFPAALLLQADEVFD
jgi:putative ABC transport system substrate-binding protein